MISLPRVYPSPFPSRPLARPPASPLPFFLVRLPTFVYICVCVCVSGGILSLAIIRRSERADDDRTRSIKRAIIEDVQ